MPENTVTNRGEESPKPTLSELKQRITRAQIIMIGRDSVPNPYQVLGLSPSATNDEIKSQYRKLMRSAHPDLHQNSQESTFVSQAITVANDHLTGNRAAVDASLGSEKNGVKRTPVDNSPIETNFTTHEAQEKEAQHVAEELKSILTSQTLKPSELRAKIIEFFKIQQSKVQQGFITETSLAPIKEAARLAFLEALETTLKNIVAKHADSPGEIRTKLAEILDYYETQQATAHFSQAEYAKLLASIQEKYATTMQASLKNFDSYAIPNGDIHGFLTDFMNRAQGFFTMIDNDKRKKYLSDFSHREILQAAEGIFQKKINEIYDRYEASFFKQAKIELNLNNPDNWLNVLVKPRSLARTLRSKGVPISYDTEIRVSQRINESIVRLITDLITMVKSTKQLDVLFTFADSKESGLDYAAINAIKNGVREKYTNIWRESILPTVRPEQIDDRKRELDELRRAGKMEFSSAYELRNQLDQMKK